MLLACENIDARKVKVDLKIRSRSALVENNYIDTLKLPPYRHLLADIFWSNCVSLLCRERTSSITSPFTKRTHFS